MKKFFSLVLALVMALSLTTIAWGVTYTYGGSNTGDACVDLTAGDDYDGLGATLNPGTGDYDAGIVLNDDAIVENVTIVGGTRGIEGKETLDATTITIDSVTILDCVRALHINTLAQANLNVSNSTFEGKISFDLQGGTATFTNCTFMYDSVLDTGKGNIMDTYDSVVFENCVFEEGYMVNVFDLQASGTPGATIKMSDCIYAGEPLATDNVDDLVVNIEDYGKPSQVVHTVPAGYVAAPTATAGVKTNFYEADSAATTKWALVDTFPGATVADFLVEADYEDGVGGNLEYYDVNGVAYVAATKATGEYKLVCGKTEIYLNVAADVFYEAEADIFTGVTTDEEACGKVLVTKKNLSKTYYTATIEVGKVEYTYYFVADKDGLYNLLVGNKIVKADYVGDDFDPADPDNDFIFHAWAGNDVDATTKAYTTVKCENCGKVAKLYANADAAGKKAVYLSGFGWISAADAAYAPVAVAPSTDKTVTSAETFDAGIAMYVGMSVMAAAGSAVVIGKKKD